MSVERCRECGKKRRRQMGQGPQTPSLPERYPLTEWPSTTARGEVQAEQTPPRLNTATPLYTRPECQAELLVQSSTEEHDKVTFLWATQRLVVSDALVGKSSSDWETV